MTAYNRKCYITNIHRGVGNKSCYVYAELRDENNELIISATIDYITKEFIKRMDLQQKSIE